MTERLVGDWDPYPEHVKLHAIADQSQIIGEFVDWLSESKGIHLAVWEDSNRSDWEGGLVPELVYAQQSITKLLAEFFGIDFKALEAEKQTMLDSIRNEAP